MDLTSMLIEALAKPKRLVLFSLVVLLFGSFNSFSQEKDTDTQKRLDSLWLVWQDETKADTTRLSALGTYSWDAYVFSKPDSALYYADILHDFAIKIGSKKHISSALSTKGTAFWLKGDFGKSLSYYQKNLEVAKEVGKKSAIASVYNKLGIVHGDLGDDIKEIDFYQKSLKLREEIGDQDGIAFTLGNIGGFYQNHGNNTKALEYHQRCLKIREELDLHKEIAFTLALIGEIYQAYEDYETAHEYFEKSLKLGKKYGEEREIAWYLENMGNIFKINSDYSKALDYYQRSMQLSVSIGAQPDISGLLVNIGDLYRIQKKYSKSVEKCKEAYQIALSIRDIRRQKSACECLYKGYKGLNNGNQALNYHEKMLSLSDSLKSEETVKKLQQMEFAKTMLQDSIAKAENDRLIETAHVEEIRKKNQTRNIAVGIGAFILLLAGILYNRLKFVRKSKASLQVEKNRSEDLLLNILPKEIAQELKDKGKAEARDFDRVSILFTDFKSFTQTSLKLSAQELVKEINTCFEAFDGIIEKYGIEKIKTIGDAYMAAGGLPVPSNESVKNTILAALEMQAFISERIISKRAKDELPFEMRLGIHTGPVVAGIVGVKKFQYDVWGDTVNTASRIESTGEIGRVNISHSTYELIKEDPRFSFEARGKIEVKGKGDLAMYFVTKSSKNSI